MSRVSSGRGQLSRNFSEPVIRVGEREFDLSNLFPQGTSQALNAQVEDEGDGCFPVYPGLRKRQTNQSPLRKHADEQEESLEQPQIPRREHPRGPQTYRRRSGKREPSLYPQRCEILEVESLHIESTELLVQSLPERNSTTFSTMSVNHNLKKAPMSNVHQGGMKLAPAVVLKKMDAPPMSYSLSGRPYESDPWFGGQDQTLSDGDWEFTYEVVTSESAAAAPPLYACTRHRSPSPEPASVYRERAPSPQSSDFYDSHELMVEPDTPELDFESDEDMVEFDVLPDIEVAPGMYKELRGSRETIHAIEKGYAVAVTCFCCLERIACVPDAEMVICPDCRVVSQLDEVDDDADRRKRPVRPPRGVGLGVKMSELACTFDTRV